MTEQHRIPDPVAEKAREIRDAEDYGSIGEVIRDVFQTAGYDV